MEDVRNIDPLTRAVCDGQLKLDIYLGLGERETRSVVDAGLCDGEPTSFLKQSSPACRAKLATPLGISSIEDLAKDDVRTVAICTDELAIGQAAEKAEGAGSGRRLSRAAGSSECRNRPRRRTSSSTEG